MQKDNDRLYFIWRDIRQKCYHQNEKMCDEWWNNFEKFKEWALFNGFEYEGDFSFYIQRKDSSLPFSPENCFFRTQKKRATDQIKTEMKIISEELKEKIANEYLTTKKSSRTLAKENDLCQRTVLNILKEKNINAMSKKIDVVDLPGEIWKTVKDSNNAYMVSNLGRVKRNSSIRSHEEIMKAKNHFGYKHISLIINGRRTTKMIHRLVAEHFLENPNNYPIVNHKNEIKDDNRVENLEWCTKQYNCAYSRNKEIISYNPITKEVKEYPSVRSTAEFGYNPSNVVMVLKGVRGTHGGLVWKYKEESKGDNNE